MQSAETLPFVAIACGGTGGHLFPGLAVAEELKQQGCAIELVISPKDVDQQAVRAVIGMDVATLPAVGLKRGNYAAFLRGSWNSYRAARKLFAAHVPQAVLAMGGFTSAPAIFAGRRVGATTFLHESNSVPGRANRWLAPFVDAAFVGFPGAAKRLRCQMVKITGTPARAQFCAADRAACRVSLGLDANRPVLLVTGGSQGASDVNDLVIRSLPLLTREFPDLQYLHLTGGHDFEKARAGYASRNIKSVLRPFLTEMELALGAATVAISRAGASSLAELAAMRLPSILIPYPAAADNHQFFNARAFVETGAARMLVQKDATPELLVEMLRDLMVNSARRVNVATALGHWQKASAAEQIAAQIIITMKQNGVSIPARAGTGPEEPASAPVSGSEARKLQVA